MTPLALTKENSATIGFVVACLFSGVIDRSELHAWADHVLVSTDSCPLYIVDLSTFDETLPHIYRVIGFTPGSGLSEAERVALIGIAFIRGRDRFEPEPAREEALAALAICPHILARFRDTFPFIDIVYAK
jgi:hypothetical protein